VLAAISALTPEKVILYVRKILKEDNVALIANGNFEIEVRYTHIYIYIYIHTHI